MRRFIVPLGWIELGRCRQGNLCSREKKLMIDMSEKILGFLGRRWVWKTNLLQISEVIISQPLMNCRGEEGAPSFVCTSGHEFEKSRSICKLKEFRVCLKP
jgi:hypothetical protein